MNRYKLPRNVVKYNNTLGKKLNKGKLNTVLFHLELKQCLYLRKQMKKDYLNYEYVMKKYQEQLDMHKNHLRWMLLHKN